MVSVDTIKGQKSAIATLGKFLPELSSYPILYGHRFFLTKLHLIRSTMNQYSHALPVATTRTRSMYGSLMLDLSAAVPGVGVSWLRLALASSHFD